MNKKSLSETDIRTKFITPALCGTGWNLMTQLREEFSLTNRRVIVRGRTVQRGEAKRPDYLLFYKPNPPIAVIEAKDNKHAVGDGMQQALKYAEIAGRELTLLKRQRFIQKPARPHELLEAVRACLDGSHAG